MPHCSQPPSDPSPSNQNDFTNLLFPLLRFILLVCRLETFSAFSCFLSWTLDSRLRRSSLRGFWHQQRRRRAAVWGRKTLCFRADSIRRKNSKLVVHIEVSSRGREREKCINSQTKPQLPSDDKMYIMWRLENFNTDCCISPFWNIFHAQLSCAPHTPSEPIVAFIFVYHVTTKGIIIVVIREREEN